MKHYLTFILACSTLWIGGCSFDLGSTMAPSEQTRNDDGSTNGPDDGQNDDNPDDGSGNPPSTVTCSGLPDKSGKYTLTMTHGGVQRTADVSIPASYDKEKAAPIIFSFHGLTSDSKSQQSLFSMDDQGNKAGFITVHPQGVDKSWNAGKCCNNNTQDDVGFFRALVSTLSTELCLDKKRIYVTGLSNGGFMSYRLACEASDLVAAAAPVAGAIMTSSCQPSRAVPILHSHGTADTLVSYDSGKAAAEKFAQLNGCQSPAQVVLTDGKWKCEQMAQCRDRSVVTLCTVDGGGHVMPWLYSSNASTTATEMILDFFSRH